MGTSKELSAISSILAVVSRDISMLYEALDMLKRGDKRKQKDDAKHFFEEGHERRKIGTLMLE